MKKYSRYNIFSKIRDSENYFIINLLTGNADILNPDEAGKIKSVIECQPVTDQEFSTELADKGYLLEEQEEVSLYRSRYLDFMDAREKDEIQIFFVTNYSCNFACSYCYQDQYNNTGQKLSNEVIDAFFSYLKKEFSHRKKYITIFGGEPLLNSQGQKELITQDPRKISQNLILT